MFSISMGKFSTSTLLHKTLSGSSTPSKNLSAAKSGQHEASINST